MAMLAAMPLTAQIKPAGIPVRAKVELGAPRAVPALNAAALGGIASATALPGDLRREEQALLRRVPERLRHKDRAAAMQDWERVVGMVRQRGARPDVDALANWVLNQAYLQPDRDLKSSADKVKFFNEQKEAAYASKAELERTQAALRRGNAQAATTRSVTLTQTYKPGARAVSIGGPKPATVESVARDLQGVVVLCNTADENSQMANLDLQNALQKQQQTLQTISNVSKTLHDTAMAVIRKIGG
jgi:hypothetical protein